MRATSLFCSLILSLLPRVSTSPLVRRVLDINTAPAEPPIDICGAIVDLNLNEGYSWFYAEDVVQCLLSVPFHADPATRFVEYLQRTLQFHATTAYLKTPPAEYQQPPVDLVQGLNQILSKIASGSYQNQYAFEVEVLQLLQRSHDGHLAVFAGITAPFTFASPFSIISVSADGKKVPDIYIYDDLVRQAVQKDPPYTASPIVSVNGRPIVDFSENVASLYAYGMLEPHADWNQLMSSAAQDITGYASVLSGNAPYFVGGDYNITVGFRNGSTSEPEPWLSYFNSPGYTGPLATGGDFYNYFALGNLPANYAEEAKRYYQAHPALGQSSGFDEQVSNASSWHDTVAAYPADTITHQPDLGTSHTGSVTGYYLEDVSTAVLSLPSFDFYSDGIDTFSDTINYFVQNATALKATKVVIDLQANAGGQIALAVDAFRYFFPKQLPVLLSRMRSHPQADILGQTLNAWAQTLPPDGDSDYYQAAVALEWVVSERINAATGRNFTSWAEFYGPFEFVGDSFSAVQQYNLSNKDFDRFNLDVEYPPCFFTKSCDDANPWDAKNIIILTDGLCASTCTLFVEMMRQMGVRSVVMGGRPAAGPMQSASGSRGAAAHSADDLSYDYMLAGNISTAAAAQAPSSDSGIVVSYLGFTLRDQMRAARTTPNQMLNIPADCRLYWTIANFYDYDRLWHDAVRAMYVDPSMCVPGSTDVKSAPKRPASTLSRRELEARNPSSGISDFIAQGLDLDRLVDPSSGVEDGLNAGTFTMCDGDEDCDGVRCIQFSFPCTAANCPLGDATCTGGSNVKQGICSRRCNGFQSVNGLTGCPSGLGCPISAGSSNKRRSVANTSGTNSGAGPGNGNADVCRPNWSQVAARTACGALTETVIRQKLLSRVST